MDTLIRIKRLVVRRQVRFTTKAILEMEQDELSPDEVLESILNAQAIDKTLRSTSRYRRYANEKLYVLKSFSYSGALIYTKGTFAKADGQEVFYVLISAKIATYDG